jgi:hypothetical protein
MEEDMAGATKKAVKKKVAAVAKKKSVTLKEGMTWLKQNFGSGLAAGVAGTPFSVDMLVAIGTQETFEVWGRLIVEGMTPAKILPLCVGDTIGAPRRTAFPATKAELLAKPNGDKMFDIARQCLIDMAAHVPAYAAAAKNQNKFCHGYGLFQYDLQHFTGKDADPDYFLQQSWGDFNHCIAKCISELTEAMRRTFGPHKTSLTDDEMVYVAIAYNAGHVNLHKLPADKFKQGFQDSSGKFYGEYMNEYLQLAKSIP